MLDKRILKFEGMKLLMKKLVGFSSLQVLFISTQSIFLAKIITNLFNGDKLKNQLIYILIFSISYIFRHLLHYIEEKMTFKLAIKTTKKLRKKLLTKALNLGPDLVNNEGSANISVISINGVFDIENYISILSIKIIEMMIIPIGLFFVLFYYDKLSAIILLLVFPVIILFMILFGLAAKEKADKQFGSYKLLSNHFMDSIQGIETLKNLGRSEKHEESVYQASENYRKKTMATLKIAMLSTFALDFFTTLSIAVVAVFLGLRLIKGEIGLYPALIILLLSPEYFLPIRQFSEDYHATLNGKNALNDIDRINEINEIEKQNNIEKIDENINIEFNNISYKYGLKNINFNINGLKKIGIIGFSGSGKTTLINMLAGFIQKNKGIIKINGKEIINLNDENWQKNIIYIPQNPYIFSTTIRENISFYTRNASIEDIKEVCRKVGLDNIIEKLPNGYDTVIGDGAQELSGGQKQRIALARAFLDKSKKIIILDEPTAHLDIETEMELKKYILELLKEKLVFFSTHRIHWCKDMDYIMLIENGEIIELGNYEELSNNNESKFNIFSRNVRGDI